MKIISSSFENNSKMSSVYTCDNKNINPPLEFVDVPESAKSLVLIVDDPDAPMGTWVHWVVFNIDPKVRKIEENSIPQGGIECMTSFGKAGYGGPCPPSGTHRYLFKLYALDKVLNLDSNSDKIQVENAMKNHVIEKAELIGLYSRA
jgi:Raf kinase inhibitor-like YbhB/YbcL family protein